MGYCKSTGTTGTHRYMLLASMVQASMQDHVHTSPTYVCSLHTVVVQQCLSGMGKPSFRSSQMFKNWLVDSWCSLRIGAPIHVEHAPWVGTNLIHDFTAVTFSVKLAFFREKRPIAHFREICEIPWNLWFFVNFNAFTFIYEGFQSFINSFCADFAVCYASNFSTK